MGAQFIEESMREAEFTGVEFRDSVLGRLAQQKHPVFSISDASVSLNMSTQTIINCIQRLKKLGSAREVSGRQRKQVFVYSTLLHVLGE